jgi:hypothetical protein
MSDLSLQFENMAAKFKPGETVRGLGGWRLDQPATSIDLRLFWYTEGKGTQDVAVAQTTTIENPPQNGSQMFQFDLPASPYSFSGKLISLIWAVEMIARPGNESTRLPLTLSSDGDEIALTSATAK